MKYEELNAQTGAGNTCGLDGRGADERRVHVPSGCGIAGIINRSGACFSGEAIYRAICGMMDRGNGLGAGYAAYGIYPELREHWCFHIMYQHPDAKKLVEGELKQGFRVVHEEPIPTHHVSTLRVIPLLWRYFLAVREESLITDQGTLSEDDFVLRQAMDINRSSSNAFVFSSGKNMGIFKGVGHPDEIGDFYGIPDYQGYLWTAHNRFPTNTVGWWGGAHPFGILDWSIVHNGEISSYGTNRNYLENFGYHCTLYTDTEVMAYLCDLLVRQHGLDFTTVGNILAAPFWSQIDRMKDAEQRRLLKALRRVYAPALVNGPFAIIAANTTTMVGLNDRIKLRPLVAATAEEYLYLASEESAIVRICPQPDAVWMPNAGEPVIASVAQTPRATVQAERG